jgi:hypothetical protein
MILRLFAFLALASAVLAADPIRPDPKLTPGDAVDVSRADLCHPGYTAKVRHVTLATKKKVFAEYGIPWNRHADFEVDHLIPLEIGGSNSIRNLWPERRSGTWGASRKDRLEGKLHRLVCSGQIDLQGAQAAIAGDWIAAYQRYVIQ